MTADSTAINDAIRDLTGADLPVGWVLMVKVAIPDDSASTGYYHFWDGDIDTRMGLLRIATMRTEHAYMTETDNRDRP